MKKIIIAAAIIITTTIAATSGKTSATEKASKADKIESAITSRNILATAD